MALAKARDRRVIRRRVGRDHARGHILHAPPFNAPRRPLPKRVDVQQQRHHHRRIVRRAAMPISAVGGVKRRQIQLGDGVDDKPREMPLGQPLAQTRRQQQLLLTVTTEKVLRHPEIVLSAADRPFPQQPPRGPARPQSSPSTLRREGCGRGVLRPRDPRAARHPRLTPSLQPRGRVSRAELCLGAIASAPETAPQSCTVAVSTMQPALLRTTTAAHGGCRTNRSGELVRATVGGTRQVWASPCSGVPLKTAVALGTAPVVPRPIDAPLRGAVCATASMESRNGLRFAVEPATV